MCTKDGRTPLTTLVGGFWVEAINGLNEMSIENQIADHNNPLEAFCSECGANMYQELGSTILQCSECDHTFETDKDNGYDY